MVKNEQQNLSSLILKAKFKEQNFRSINLNKKIEWQILVYNALFEQRVVFS